MSKKNCSGGLIGKFERGHADRPTFGQTGEKERNVLVHPCLAAAPRPVALLHRGVKGQEARAGLADAVQLEVGLIIAAMTPCKDKGREVVVPRYRGWQSVDWSDNNVAQDFVEEEAIFVMMAVVRGGGHTSVSAHATTSR